MVDIEKIKQKKPIKELLEFGMINIDKPSGPTSFEISDSVRKTLKNFGIRKTSHFGTLDPKVTGVLPVALNRACKLTGFFLGEDKEYVGIMRMHEDVDLKKIEIAIQQKFTGKIMQKPPVKSRVARVLREREIKSFEITEKDGKDFLFKTEVQGGTYIRKLIDDLGLELGIGAHMLELRRIRAGIFKEDDEKYPIVNLYQLDEAVEQLKKGNEKLLRDMIIPGEVVTKLFSVFLIKKDAVERMLRGSPIYPEYFEKNPEKNAVGLFCAFSGDRFIGIYKFSKEGRIVARPEFVMQPLG